MPQVQFQKREAKTNSSPESSEEDRNSTVTSCTGEPMRSEIGHMTLEKTFEEQDTLNQAVVRMSTKQPELGASSVSGTRFEK